MILPEKLKHTFEKKLLSEMEAHVVRKSIPEGTVIMRKGDPIIAMPIVVQGTLKVSSVDEEGREILMYYIGAMESCAMTFTCCMQNKASEIQAEAESDVEILAIPVNYMDVWMEKYPSWKTFVMSNIQMRFEEMVKTIDQLAFHNLDDRLLNYLIEKSKILDSRLINISHEKIAFEMATSRVVISRVLKKLESNDKLLLFRNQIKLLKDK